MKGNDMTNKERIVKYLQRRGFDLISACEIYETQIRPAVERGVYVFIGRGYAFQLKAKG